MPPLDFLCATCSRTTSSDSLDPSCRSCGSPVTVAPGAFGRAQPPAPDMAASGVWRYRAFLPPVAPGEEVTLGEGATPLLPARRLGAELGLPGLLIKDESRNPTGSFLDRGSTVLVSLARKLGVAECACLTTGNLGASLAAYCAKAGMEARVSVSPSTDREKLYQMLAYGAQVVAPSRHGRPRGGRTLSVDAANPFLLEGEKTTCFEVFQDLGWRSPDAVVVPVGTGGHLAMFWRAMKEIEASGLARPSCRLYGVQLGGKAPEGLTELSESQPYFLGEAGRCMRVSGGGALTTDMEAAIRAMGQLAKSEGVFAEPASSSVISAVASARREGVLSRDDVVVAVVTGAGLKDTRAVQRLARSARRVQVRAGYAAARAQVGDTKVEILRLIAPDGSYGCAIWQRLSEGRRISTASVYQHLVELEGMLLVRRGSPEVAGGRERVRYELTRKGAELLKVAGRP